MWLGQPLAASTALSVRVLRPLLAGMALNPAILLLRVALAEQPVAVI
jgi:hypothetical protein